MPASKRQNERIAVLETQVKAISATQAELLQKQDQMLTELARYRGAIGLATILFSAIGAALMIFKDAVLVKLGMKG